MNPSPTEPHTPESVKSLSLLAKVHLLDKTLTPGTLTQYLNRVKNIENFMQAQQLTVMDVNAFALFLENLLLKTRNPCKNTAEGYRSAVAFFQLRDNLWVSEGDFWSSSPTAYALVKGYGYNSKQTMPRAAVEATLFAEMKGYLTEHAPEMKNMFVIAYLVALRPHELCSLCAFRYNTDDETVLIPDKRARSSNNRSIMTRKFVADAEARSILETLEGEAVSRIIRDGRHADRRYFPFSQNNFSRQFKDLALHLQWQQRFNLKFDGPHTLRHGGMQYLDDVLTTAGFDESTREDLMQISHSVKPRYLKPNSQR